MSQRLEFAKAGMKHYHGKPCKNCGETLRFVISADCVSCNRKRSLANSKKVREAIKEAMERARLG